MRLLFIFLDGSGSGSGSADPARNPLAAVQSRIFTHFADGRSGPIAFDGRMAETDACLGVPGLPQSATGQATLLSSDHGNFEDFSVRSHTRNPVYTICWGRGRDELVSRVQSIADVTPALVGGRRPAKD